LVPGDERLDHGARRDPKDLGGNTAELDICRTFTYLGRYTHRVGLSHRAASSRSPPDAVEFRTQ
jgi:hypothetical protein